MPQNFERHKYKKAMIYIWNLEILLNIRRNMNVFYIDIQVVGYLREKEDSSK